MSLKINPLLNIDGYKSSHRKMYPEGTTLVYSNYTCRSTKRMPNEAKDVVVFGIQYMCKYINELWQENFFNQPKEQVISEAKKFLESYLGMEYKVEHFGKLHELGYLPIEIKALEEGTIIQEGIPLFTIKNTHPDFFWLTNFLETSLSTLIWKPVHSASLAYAYKRILTKYTKETNPEALEFVDFQGHDFSFRGMQSIESAISSGMGFLTSFSGTDTIPALQGIKHYYGDENVGFSVPASEHSTICAHGKDGEIDTFKYVMEQYPKGILSMVSDTWDLWKVLTKFLPQLKEEILSRDGKLVIRPDSGDPVNIICGCLSKLKNGNQAITQNEYKGVIELLWDIFGGTTNKQGYKVLNSHIGALYGDSITLERAEQICERLKAKGFASTNIVLGIGSYSMGYATRDNQGGAVKSTYVEVNGKARNIFKNPITDNGEKKSKCGLLAVTTSNNNENFGDIIVYDKCTWEEEAKGLLKTVFLNGKLTRETTLTEIRERLNKLK